MLLDIIRFYTDFRIPIAPPHHKHTRRGWVNTICPFHQGSTGGYHLGYNLVKGYFFCFGCGWHPTDLTIQTFTKTDKRQAKKILQSYESTGQLLKPNQQEEPYEKPDKLKWPEGYGRMVAAHRNYLLRRGFNPEGLEREWDLGGTRYWGFYAFRIVVPIVFRGEVVSWQSRDITDKQKAKYLPCPKEQELLHHKQLLYGLDKAKGRIGVVVEGVTGVWRLGPGAVATFGVEYTSSQLLLLCESFDEIRILYDGDEPGQRAAEQMGCELGAMGREVEILEPVGCDSGDMPQEIADKIMKEVQI